MLGEFGELCGWSTFGGVHVWSTQGEYMVSYLAKDILESLLKQLSMAVLEFSFVNQEYNVAEITGDSLKRMWQRVNTDTEISKLEGCVIGHELRRERLHEGNLVKFIALCPHTRR